MIPRWRTFIVVTLGYIAGGIAFPRLPGPYWPAGPTVWTAAAVIAFALPTAAALLCSLLVFLWRRDRVRPDDPTRNVVFHAIELRIAVFIVALHVLVVFTLTGTIPPSPWAGRTVIVLLGVVIALVGNLLPRIRPNIVFGLRTSRATSNPLVWARTHRVAGYGMVLFGTLLSLVAMLAPGSLVPVITVPTAGAVAAAVLLTHQRAVSENP